jgi:hypothetical protein
MSSNKSSTLDKIKLVFSIIALAAVVLLVVLHITRPISDLASVFGYTRDYQALKKKYDSLEVVINQEREVITSLLLKSQVTLDSVRFYLITTTDSLPPEVRDSLRQEAIKYLMSQQ